MTENNIKSLDMLQEKIKVLIVIFIFGLLLSGLTAFPIETQLAIAHRFIQNQHWNNEFTVWIEKVYTGVKEINIKYPFIAYGTDWLAFAHIVIAIAFIGPLRDPIRNIWVIQFGLIACIAIFPLAAIAGEIREIPLLWRMIDCSFGLFGGIILWSCYKNIRQLETIQKL